MVIETTIPFNNSLDAQRSLDRLKNLPGFILGYVTLTEQQQAQEFHVVTLFQCNSVAELPRDQRHLIEFRANPVGFLNVPPTLHSSIPTSATTI